MLISEVIKSLEQVKAEQGDIEVCTQDYDGELVPVGEIVIDTGEDGEFFAYLGE